MSTIKTYTVDSCDTTSLSLKTNGTTAGLKARSTLTWRAGSRNFGHCQTVGSINILYE